MINSTIKKFLVGHSVVVSVILQLNQVCLFNSCAKMMTLIFSSDAHLVIFVESANIK